jgi:ACS family pantothenate transporter-like MFS transporter
MSIGTVSPSFRSPHPPFPTTNKPQFFGFLSSLLLAVWAIPTGLKWFAYFSSRAAVAYGPISLSWANEICTADAEERALVIGIMNSMGYAFNAWLPLLTYPAKEAPRFKKGFVFSTVAYVAQFGITGTVAWLWSQQRARNAKLEETEARQGRL